MSALASGDALAAAVGALVGIAGGLPEPELDPEPAEGAETEPSRFRIAPVHTKEPYADLARRPHLALRLSVLGALVGVVLGGALGWSADLLVWLPLVPAGVWLGYVDWRTTYLPTRIIAPMYAVLVAAILLAGLVDGDRSAVVRAVGGWALYGGYFLLMWIITPGFGYGDVRLSGLLGLALGWLGWFELVAGMLAGLLLTAFLGLALTLLKVVERGRNPAGPHLLAGAALAAVLGPWLATQLGY